MVTLKDHMHEVLDGWSNAVPEAWREVFDGIEPDLSVPELDLPHDGVGHPAYPRYKREDAPPDAPHLVRAFDDLRPDQVRVVFIGQDPYPDEARATGRAFEDRKWDGGAGLALSLQCLFQSAILSARDDLQIAAQKKDWSGSAARWVQGT